MYDILRIKKSKSREGKDEVFFSITINDDLGEYNYGKWLTDTEYSLYTQDENNINSIIENHLPRARANFIRSLEANKNQPIEEME